MPRIILIFAMVLIAVPNAGAETVSRPYQAVMHVVESHARPVLDNPDHVVGIGAFRGLAIFDDGEIVRHRYEGWFDLVDGIGRFHGHALWSFEDGSEIRAGYGGEATEPAGNGIHVRASFHSFTGTGRFENAELTGMFEGRRVEPISQGGLTHLRGKLEITR